MSIFNLIIKAFLSKLKSLNISGLCVSRIRLQCRSASRDWLLHYHLFTQWGRLRCLLQPNLVDNLYKLEEKYDRVQSLLYLVRIVVIIIVEISVYGKVFFLYFTWSQLETIQNELINRALMIMK